MSPWCYKRLEAFGGVISQFRVAKIQLSRLRQIAIAKTEPVKFSLRSRAQNAGKNPSWTSYKKIREVIEKHGYSRTSRTSCR
jgi:predicted Ser/Thr protein kinase